MGERGLAAVGYGQAGPRSLTWPGPGPGSGTSVNSHHTTLEIKSDRVVTTGGGAGDANARSALSFKKGEFDSASATEFISFTVPNANHSAGFRIFGNAWRTAGDTSMAFDTIGTISRVSGADTKFVIMSPTKSTVSDGTDGQKITDITLDFNTLSGGSSATQVRNARITVTTADGSDQINVTYFVELLNCNDSGITIGIA